MDVPAWVEEAIRHCHSVKVLHRNYVANVKQLQLALLVALPGEVITVVGPSRVGKTKAVREATRAAYATTVGHAKPVIYVEAENASRDGEFSSKGFMMQCLRAVEHPIFGGWPSTPHGHDQFLARLHRATESTLRDAFEAAIATCETQVLVVDEAHHFGYVRGGQSAAARILDSLKCLVNKTDVKLVLTGSYALLDIISLAPHLLGRHHPIEFPRYKSDVSDDIVAWRQLLNAYAEGHIPSMAKDGLQSWAKLLFDGSFGCVGHLSRWLRDSLARAAECGLPGITEEALLASQIPYALGQHIAAEIIAGERMMARGRGCDDIRWEPTHNRVEKTASSTAFQRNARRSPRGGRA